MGGFEPPSPTRRARAGTGQPIVRHSAYEELGGRREALDALLVDLEEAARPSVLDEHEARLGEPAQVLGDRRLPDVDAGDDLAHGHRAAFVREHVEDLQPRRIGEAAEPARVELCLVSRELHRSSTINDEVPLRKAGLEAASPPAAGADPIHEPPAPRSMRSATPGGSRVGGCDGRAPSRWSSWLPASSPRPRSRGTRMTRSSTTRSSRRG